MTLAPMAGPHCLLRGCEDLTQRELRVLQAHRFLAACIPLDAGLLLSSPLRPSLFSPLSRLSAGAKPCGAKLIATLLQHSMQPGKAA